MEKLTFKVSINAPRNKVWEILWGDTTYSAWTAPFAEGSKIESDWEVGGRTLFLDGKGSGMVSTIAKKVPNEYMSFKHLGEIQNGVEDLTSEKVKGWSGATENYTLTDADGGTVLAVDMDAEDEFKDYLNKTFPASLDKLKELAEK
jgi:uncharacterized protein YndB with AHSA1/START domain